MKKSLLIAVAMLSVLTAIAGGTRIFKNKTANGVVNNEAIANYENYCMALDCLDSQLLASMEENEDFAFANVAEQINTLRTQVEANNGNINHDEFFAALESIQNEMK